MVKSLPYYTLVFITLAFGVSGSAQYSEEDWKERDQWMELSKIFEWTDVREGYVVADIGCHEGYFSMHLAKKVGNRGTVFAVDVREDRLKTLKEIAIKRKLENIQAIKGDYDNPKLPGGQLDIVFIMDTYHEMDDHEEILAHVKKALKPQGKIVILEKLKKHSRNKSRSHQAEAHTLSPKYVKKELSKAGFTINRVVTDFGRWENNPDKKMWILIGEKEIEKSK